ncbi:hypothetical protein HOLleu_29695 [Holothuria leucospilota]|uniref:Reverse transcriptase RNase H-like domain-containing protein n=1 Tax=Holothuria leucospilota TaxID=206669 RepID=A0A9Q1BJE8_HOLLE|nr:hypothetical protein HOLleu_29695 [Holothuria leucospilota]
MPKREGCFTRELFTLYSDTSRVATGSYLTQTINGKEWLLGYYFKVLPEACTRNSVTGLELFGLIININSFVYILKNVEFDAFVDHAALVEILTSKREPPTSRLRNLLFTLSQFSFKIGYNKGSELGVADYLSRAPQNDDSEIDRILPLAFSAVSEFLENDSDDHALPGLTRARAEALGVWVPDLLDLFYGRKTSPPPAERSRNVHTPAPKSYAPPRQSLPPPASQDIPPPCKQPPVQPLPVPPPPPPLSCHTVTSCQVKMSFRRKLHKSHVW